VADETPPKPQKKPKAPTKGAGRPKGTPKTGGRVKGTPNKASTFIREELQAGGLNLVARYLEEVSAIEAPEARLAALLQIFPYVYPKLRELEGETAEKPTPPTPAAPAAGEPSAPRSQQERLALIRGSHPGKPEASG
jgi:hypothetical protein